MYIFDKVVVPMLLYGSEVCAIGNISDLEKESKLNIVKLYLIPRQKH